MLPLYLLFAPLKSVPCRVGMPSILHMYCTYVTHTVFLYVCTFIIRSFVHSGSIVADREMFDISAILHFCVSNKKHFVYYESRCAEERQKGGSGGGAGTGGGATFETRLAQAVARRNKWPRQGGCRRAHVKCATLPQDHGVQSRNRDWLNLNMTRFTPESCSLFHDPEETMNQRRDGRVCPGGRRARTCAVRTSSRWRR